MPGAGAVLWKELREQYLRRGHPAVSFWIGAGLDVAVAIALPSVFASMAPTSQGRDVFLPAASLGAISAVMFLAIITPLAVVIDLVAGERERHTLETLLATPLTDRAILWGKMGMMYLAVATHATLFGVVFTATMTVYAGLGGLVAGLAVLVGGLVAALLVAGVLIGIGLLLSLRAATVKQGQQWMAFVLMPLWIALGMAGPTGFFGLQGRLTAGEAWVIPAVAGPALVLLDLLLLWAVHAAFRRERLLAR